MTTLWMDCEGSQCLSHVIDDHVGRCTMCGEVISLDAFGLTVEHKRKDLLTMIARGDFAAPAPYPKAEEPQ